MGVGAQTERTRQRPVSLGLTPDPASRPLPLPADLTVWAAERNSPLPVTSPRWGTLGPPTAIPWPWLHVSFQIQGPALHLAHPYSVTTAQDTLLLPVGGRPPCPVRWAPWTPTSYSSFSPTKDYLPNPVVLTEPVPRAGLSMQSGAATPAARLPPSPPAWPLPLAYDPPGLH